MARQPRPRARARGLSAYERRIEKYLAAHPGATRQEARGHKPREHATRAERSIARGELVSAQRQAISRFARKQASRIPGSDPDALREQLQGFAQAQGFEQFEALKGEVARLHKIKRRRVRVRIRRGTAVIRMDLTGRSANLDRMEALAAAWGIDMRLLFYH